MAKLRRWTHDGRYYFHMFQCPGCDMEHAVRLEQSSQGPAVHTFNGDYDKPTLQASVLVNWVSDDKGKMVCHSYVEAGQIRFLSDCTHGLAGKTVDLPEVVMPQKPKWMDFPCQAQGADHLDTCSISINGQKNGSGASWKVAGADQVGPIEAPTVSPSIRCGHRCHFHITAGEFVYCDDHNGRRDG